MIRCTDCSIEQVCRLKDTQRSTHRAAVESFFKKGSITRIFLDLSETDINFGGTSGSWHSGLTTCLPEHFGPEKLQLNELALHNNNVV